MNRRDRMSRVFLSTFHSLISRPNDARVNCTNCGQLREVARKNGVSVMFRTLGERATHPGPRSASGPAACENTSSCVCSKPVPHGVGGAARGGLESAHMSSGRIVLSCFWIALAVSACQDADGNRVNMREWWRERTGPDPSEEEPSSDRRVDERLADRATVDPDDGDSTDFADDRQSSNIADTSATPPGRSTDRGPDRSSPTAVHSDVLIINDQIITVSDVLDPIEPQLEASAGRLAPAQYYKRRNAVVRRAVIEAVAERLIWQEAKFLISEQVEPQIMKAVDRLERSDINRHFDGRETRYETHLASIGKQRGEVREALKRKVVVNQYLRDKLVPMVSEPTKRELEKYYRRHIADFSSEPRTELFLIDVPVAMFFERGQIANERTTAVAREKARAAADAATAALDAGEPFEAVAKKYSEGRMKGAGGAYGFVSTRKSPLVERYDPAWERLCRMKPDERSEVFEAHKAFFIVKAGRVESGEGKSFSEAQREIATKIRDQKFVELRANFFQERFDRAHISSLDDFYQNILNAAPKPSMAGRAFP